jgi:WD40 repeat protein
MTDASTTRKAKVFVSYSRDDIAFADQLVAALEGTGFDPLIDRDSIPGGEDWQAQLRHMIVEADSVVFVLSPRSAASKLCEWEVEEANQLNKRLIPIVCASLEGVSVPPRLTNLNYIYFYPEPKVSGSGFGSGLARLVAALNTDLDWVQNHTRLGALSERWQTRKKDAALLLRGDELEDAERWLARKPPNAPEPTELLRAFLSESRRAEAARLDKERQQLAEIDAAQKNVAAEQARTAAAQARTARFQWITRLAVVAVGAIMLIAGVTVAYLQFDKARQLERDKNVLDHARANLLAELAGAQLARGELDSALRLTTHGTRIDLAIPSGAIVASPAAAQLAGTLFQIKWLFGIGGHEGSVLSAAFNHDGSRIVTASRDHTVRIWDATSAKEIAVLRGHDNSVSSAAFSPDGSRIVTASADNTVRIWDAVSAKETAVLRGHDQSVYSAVFSPNGSRIVSSSADNTARIWDAASGKEIAVLRGQDQILRSSFSPDGSRVVTASFDGTAHIWNAATAKEIAVLRGHEGPAWSAAFSPDGSRIVTASADKTARIWNVVSAKQIAVLRGHEDIVASAVFSPDGLRIVTASTDRSFRIWDAVSANEIAVLRGHENALFSAVVSPDGWRCPTAEG